MKVRREFPDNVKFLDRNSPTVIIGYHSGKNQTGACGLVVAALAFPQHDFGV